MPDYDIGLYGLAVMGQNLVLNIADNGFPIAIYNRTHSITEEFEKNRINDKPIKATYDIDNFVGSLKKPRAIVLMVKAGDAVDAVIEKLKPHLEAGDILIDGGNSHYKDTNRRLKALANENIHYIGMGISGGEDGARYGPSLMPGGSKEAYERVQAILEVIAAKANGEPCVAYLGEGSAGHYVKMVHNGIEYGIMQAIAEVYDLLKTVTKMEATAIGQVFREWNDGQLASFLVDITAQIFAYVEHDTSKALINQILDSAKQKGTGKWTTQDALDMGVSVPTISAATEARLISALKQERDNASSILAGPELADDEKENVYNFVDMLESALLATMICCYAQGFATLHFASSEYGYNLNLAEVARIWRNGCIIRSDMLDDIQNAFTEDAQLPNLMIAPYFRDLLKDCQSGWRGINLVAVRHGIPIPAISSALTYYDSYRRKRLPANLIQAQRDYFGAHTYERIDRDGKFHTEWQEYDVMT